MEKKELKGIFAIIKPKGPSSFKMIEKLRRITGERRIGYAGTLDPLASGVLVVGVGREATKKLDSVVQSEKEYRAKIFLGERSETFDSEGDKEEVNKTRKPKLAEIKSVLELFKGEINQTPPKFSALKVKGVPSYKRARRGEDFKLKDRKVFIKEIELLRYDYPYLEIRVVSGQGTYIRSLANDIGVKLGVGGYVLELERTRVGEFTKEKARSLN